LERNIFKNNTTSAAPSYVASRSGINVWGVLDECFN
jgi:hypothetical protein